MMGLRNPGEVTRTTDRMRSDSRAGRPCHVAWASRPWMMSLALIALAIAPLRAADHALVLQTDFGTKDGAVAAMRGVAFGVSSKLHVLDLSHENTPYNIWEAAYRLKQTAPFWPAGTVFVSVVDPGVGTERKSIVLRTKSGHYFVGPDNGTFTLVAEDLGIAEVREIDGQRNRRTGSEESYTFHGRDVYAFVGARLAAGVIRFAGVGPVLPPKIVMLSYEKPRREGNVLVGTIPALDYQYGNVWTNLDAALFRGLQPKVGERFRVTIARGGETVHRAEIPYANTFGDVPEGAPLLYLNSLMNVSFALNMGDFAKKHAIGSGGEWSVRLEKVAP
jgi:S-adenosylmethionine hydrolase